MTIWLPDLSFRPGPRYRALVDALSEEVADGRRRSMPVLEDAPVRCGSTAAILDGRVRSSCEQQAHQLVSLPVDRDVQRGRAAVEGDAIHVHRGDMFGIAAATGRTLPLAQARLLAPTVPSTLCASVIAGSRALSGIALESKSAPAVSSSWSFSHHEPPARIVKLSFQLRGMLTTTSPVLVSEPSALKAQSSLSSPPSRHWRSSTLNHSSI